MELAAAKMIGAGLAAIALAGVGVGMGSSKTISYFIIRICSYRSYRFICFSYRSFNTFCILIIKIN